MTISIKPPKTSAGYLYTERIRTEKGAGENANVIKCEGRNRGRDWDGDEALEKVTKGEGGPTNKSAPWAKIGHRDSGLGVGKSKPAWT